MKKILFLIILFLFSECYFETHPYDETEITPYLEQNNLTTRVDSTQKTTYSFDIEIYNKIKGYNLTNIYVTVDDRQFIINNIKYGNCANLKLFCDERKTTLHLILSITDSVEIIKNLNYSTTIYEGKNILDVTDKSLGLIPIQFDSNVCDYEIKQDSLKF